MAVQATVNTMQAAVLVDEGDPGTAIEVRSELIPDTALGGVRVRLTHAALNHLDVWIRKGMPSVPKPRIMGADGAGVLDDAAPTAAMFLRARGLDLGDRVLVDPGIACGACRPCALGDTALCDNFQVLGEHLAGTHAQYVRVPVENVHRIPPHLDDGHAAALTLAFATAWRMLFTRAQLKPGERVVVWGASSGVGTAALQLCAAAGIETLATTRSHDKVEELTALGASRVVVTDGDAEAWGARFVGAAKEFTLGDGVDVVFDHLGSIAWKPSMQVMRKGGRYVTCGATSGANPPAQVTRLFWKQLAMLGSTMASRSDVAAMLAFVTEHRITPRVDRTFALHDVGEAHRYLEASQQIGKVVLDVR